MEQSLKPTTSRNPGLHRFAIFTALATLCLLGAGGLVTSHGAGLAVPDWPNTYGYNMFFFPISRWAGGIFYEHTHRLIASAVGLLTVILALWLYGWRARPLMKWGGLVLLVMGAVTIAALPHHLADGVVTGVTGLAALTASRFWPQCEPSVKWLRRCGLVALAAVIFQGVLGGLRVVLLKDAIGIFHATLAQLFFLFVCAIALFTSRWWQARSVDLNSREVSAAGGRTGSSPSPLPSPLGRGRMVGSESNDRARKQFEREGLRIPASVCTLLLLTTLLILGQLTLGAAMRHQHAGLAIPDFPLAYGKLWPAMDAASVQHYNQQRWEIVSYNPITAGQIALQMAHRLVAVTILAAVAFTAWFSRRKLGSRNLLSRLALGWLALIFVQVLLGAATIWSNKAADVATAHVLVGALSLALGGLMSIIGYREAGLGRRAAEAPSAASPPGLNILKPQPSGAAGLH